MLNYRNKAGSPLPPNRTLKVLGQCKVEVSVHGKEANLPLIVVEGSLNTRNKAGSPLQAMGLSI